jgi:hypothetical protein
VQGCQQGSKCRGQWRRFQESSSWLVWYQESWCSIFLARLWLVLSISHFYFFLITKTSQVFWLGSLALLIFDWRSGKLVPHHHREQPFDPPARSQDEETEEDGYEHVPPVRRNTGPGAGGYNSPSNTYPEQISSRYGGSSQTPSGYTPAAGRSSMDAYGAFSDPAPSGFGTSGAYNNNYASSSSPARAPTAPPTLPEPEFGQPMLSRTMQYADPYAAVRATIQAPTTPPSYESYQGYR